MLPIVGRRDGRLSMEPRIRWWSPYSRPFRSTDKVPKKGSLKRCLGGDEGFFSTPIKIASLIGNTVNWRYCMGKEWELTNQLGLNLESKWWMWAPRWRSPLPLIEKKRIAFHHQPDKSFGYQLLKPWQIQSFTISSSWAAASGRLAASASLFYPCGWWNCSWKLLMNLMIYTLKLIFEGLQVFDIATFSYIFYISSTFLGCII